MPLRSLFVCMSVGIWISLDDELTALSIPYQVILCMLIYLSH